MTSTISKFQVVYVPVKVERAYSAFMNGRMTKSDYVKAVNYLMRKGCI